MAEADLEFWKFSLALYEKPGVAPACLELQDRFGCDVIIALFCCWVGATGRGRITPQTLAAVEGTVRPWRQHVVEPLRATRRALKDVAGAEDIYKRMKTVELEAEREAHRKLAPLAAAPDSAADAADRRAAAAANLSLYVGEETAAASKAALVAAL
jgi:uncharacterized protein (TIGR02444 family)